MNRALPRGLYGIADAGFGDPVALGLALADAGVEVIQLRAKGWSEADLLEAARALLPGLRARGSLLIVNDSLAVAAEIGADGVHLGQEDPPWDLTEARAALPPGALIGRSTRTLEQVLAAQDADYLGFGPVYATTTRAGSPAPRGPALLAEAVRLSARPVVAIGGIGPEGLAEVKAAGAWGWAVISSLLTAPSLIEAARALR